MNQQDTQDSDFRRAVTWSVTALAEAWNRQASEATYQAYELGLTGLTPQQIHEATERVLQTCRFMPAPAELRELATAGGDSIQTRSLKAWEAVTRAVRRHGPYKTVDFDDPLVNGAIRLIGGWMRVCDTEGRDYDVWLRKEFREAYEGLCRGEPDGELCQPNPGLFLTVNGSHHKHDQPVEFKTGLPIPEQHQRLRVPADRRAADVPRVAFQEIPE